MGFNRLGKMKEASFYANIYVQEKGRTLARQKSIALYWGICFYLE